MNDVGSQQQAPKQRSRVRWLAIAFIIIALFTIFAAANFYYYYPSQLGPLQPIPFSHRIHVTNKQISCMMCHSGAIDTPHAGIPPLETCMLCHSKIIIHHPRIADLRDHYFQRKPVPWVRIAYLPDFVHFDHRCHIIRGVDCGKCHGDVSQMDRVTLVNNFNMGFCVQCHRDEKVSHDCFVCHY